MTACGRYVNARVLFVVAVRRLRVCLYLAQLPIRGSKGNCGKLDLDQGGRVRCHQLCNTDNYDEPFTDSAR